MNKLHNIKEQIDDIKIQLGIENKNIKKQEKEFGNNIESLSRELEDINDKIYKYKIEGNKLLKKINKLLEKLEN